MMSRCDLSGSSVFSLPLFFKFHSYEHFLLLLYLNNVFFFLTKNTVRRMSIAFSWFAMFTTHFFCFFVSRKKKLEGKFSYLIIFKSTSAIHTHKHMLSCSLFGDMFERWPNALKLFNNYTKWIKTHISNKIKFVHPWNVCKKCEKRLCKLHSGTFRPK